MLAFVVDDGYLGFRARVRRCVDKLKEIEWSETGPILLKPTNSASQAKFAPLAESDEELAVQLASTWNLTAKRKNGQVAFKLELSIYVSKVSASMPIRRASEGRIAAATSLIDEHLSSLPVEDQLGDASRAYWAVSHARQLEQTPLVMPTNPTFNQLRRINALQRDADVEIISRTAPRDFVTVRCRLTGGLVPLELHVAELREALGLPDYDLRPPFREPLLTSSPTVNVEDVDLMSDTSME
ncbi:hypothetical protein, variant [Phytophthora nicotianae CJ01A1]|uniref:Uncharacterized protein n=1 Tax=Phytophthora nicotianae CJ01A1 TaxID=1317063 RepID=W2X022_PHYNI|nr:hypothetical protein F441_09503 [Phytophthora nicotianae CJ01A1]ETP15754.1 hypothetical protein, variant [Phytophthora nicotianae CJ01A1]